LHDSYEILDICMHLSVAFMFLIWSVLGNKWHFPHKFSIALVAKLLIMSEIVRGEKMGWTSYPYAKFAGDHMLHISFVMFLSRSWN